MVTDHNPLTSLRGLKDVGGHLNRWTLFLQQFIFTFQYKPGIQHGSADALSHRPPVEEINTIHDSLYSIDIGNTQSNDDYF